MKQSRQEMQDLIFDDLTLVRGIGPRPLHALNQKAVKTCRIWRG